MSPVAPADMLSRLVIAVFPIDIPSLNARASAPDFVVPEEEEKIYLILINVFST